MTTAVTLTTSWQEIAGTGTKLASFETDGEIFVGLGALAPTDTNYHIMGDGDIFAVTSDEKMWAKKESDTGDSYANDVITTSIAI